LTLGPSISVGRRYPNTRSASLPIVEVPERVVQWRFGDWWPDAFGNKERAARRRFFARVAETKTRNRAVLWPRHAREGVTDAHARAPNPAG
jgi:hypothetical protein